MKAILIFSLFALCAFATQHTQLNQIQMKKIEQIQSERWGNIILKLAELHMKTQGPIDDLIVGIQSIIADLGVKEQKATDDYEDRTQKHEYEVKRLGDAITNCEVDIADTQAFLDDTLYPQKEFIQNEIFTDNKTIEDNLTKMDELKRQRGINHEDYQRRADEHQEAIEALDQITKILNELIEGDNVSMIQTSQVNQIRGHIETVKKHSDKMDNAWINVLTEISTAEFADEVEVGKVIALIQEIKGNLQSSAVQNEADEEQSLNEYNDEVKERTKENNHLNLKIKEDTDDLNHTIDTITEDEEFIVTRQGDKDDYTTALNNENDAFDQATKNYNDLMTAIATEEQACNDALDVIQNADFADYIVDRTEGIAHDDMGHHYGDEAISVERL